MIAESGFGTERLVTAGPGATKPRFAGEEIEWWARLGSHYVPWVSYVRVRWIDPDGSVVREDEPRRTKRVYLTDALTDHEEKPAPGTWRLEVLLGDDVVHEQPFEVAH